MLTIFICFMLTSNQQIPTYVNYGRQLCQLIFTFMSTKTQAKLPYVNYNPSPIRVMSTSTRTITPSYQAITPLYQATALFM